MTQLVEFKAGNGEKILVEVENVASEELKPVAKDPGEIAAEAGISFAKALDNLKPMIQSVKEKVNSMTDRADEVEVKFSVKLNAEVGAVLTKVGGEANYEITLKWVNK